MPIYGLSKPNLIITIGDAAGIGPEVVFKALSCSNIRNLAKFFIVGDFSAIKKRASFQELNFSIELISECSKITNYKNNIVFLDKRLLSLSDFNIGISTAKTGMASFEYFKHGVNLILKNSFDAIITAPVNKQAINRAGINFHGHTEYLARVCKLNINDVLMILTSNEVTVGLVTRHVPLKRVSSVLSKEKIYKAICIADLFLRKSLKKSSPKIVVSCFNPHCGEGKMKGGEEEEYIIPAIELAKSKNIKAYGPLPSDTLFCKEIRDNFDLILCLYHDQGLIPFKITSFDKGVNITAGLPFIRTSPSHGTALDIAKEEKASPQSMIEAIKMAVKLCRH